MKNKQPLLQCLEPPKEHVTDTWILHVRAVQSAVLWLSHRNINGTGIFLSSSRVRFALCHIRDTLSSKNVSARRELR